MVSINIKTANTNTVEAIKALLVLDPSATFDTCSESYISEADEKRLESILQRDKKGEVKYYSQEQVDKHADELLAKLGAKV